MADLEQRLSLLSWMNSRFGFHSNQELLSTLKDVREGFDGSGESGVFNLLESRSDRLEISLDDLRTYDGNVRAHLHALNEWRPDPITFRYFQHLAALYSEFFLDQYFNHRNALLAALNRFVQSHNQKTQSGVEWVPFAEDDLAKLAFWMATGSGKTLLLHLNYRQFLHYNKTPLDNVLLVTPNEGLSEQHQEEMALSGIPNDRFRLEESGLTLGPPDAVSVIEITKLVEQKRGGGVSVPVEAFEGNNLIFVDEGHKGSGGAAWRGFREALSRTGFTFEYSATFGQALSAAGNDDLTEEYGKAIVFDYSYKYFHQDGYGKDFRILNLQKETAEEQTRTLLLGNLLSFYEQVHLFASHPEELKPYNLERPLWVFVGRTVNPGSRTKEDRTLSSDVLTVADFLHRFLSDAKWAKATIGDLLKGRTNLPSDDSGDLFAGKFDRLKASRITPAKLYGEILTHVFHASSGGGLHLCDLRGHPGELGLKVAGSDQYFGLIYIGDTGTFKSLVEESATGIVLEEDAISDSLFDGIHRRDTTIDVLIGAKKFTEGWNSWRVSTMGLLNIGRSEGSEIIQLFGRGVRLRGKGFSLKRSSHELDDHPDYLRLLETLNIFSVRANYMADFRKYLEQEGVETEPVRQFALPIRPNTSFLKKGLVVPRPGDSDFKEERLLVLDTELPAKPRVDLSMKVQVLAGEGQGIQAQTFKSGKETRLIEDQLHLVDWEEAWFDLLQYKEQRDYSNVVIQHETCRRIVESEGYTLICDEDALKIETFAERTRIQDAVHAVLRKYLDAWFRYHREKWDSETMVYRKLDATDPNLDFRGAGDSDKPGYAVYVPGSKTQLIADIESLMNRAADLYEKTDRKSLPRLHFDRHLYDPLLIAKKNDGLTSRPPRLNEGEERFIQDLGEFWKAEKDGEMKGAEVFLLRNLSRGAGIGFFEEKGFYPDFVLWIKKGREQRIVFVEPHGMVFADAYENDGKARLHEKLPELAADIAKRSRRRNISLDSFIVSRTPYDTLRRKRPENWDRETFARHHILFQEERTDKYDYIWKILCPEGADA